MVVLWPAVPWAAAAAAERAERPAEGVIKEATSTFNHVQRFVGHFSDVLNSFLIEHTSVFSKAMISCSHIENSWLSGQKVKA
jgi:hypothetical protein